MIDLHLSQLNPCGANLALHTSGSKGVDLVPGTDLPMVQDPHLSPSNLEQGVSAEGAQERSR